MIDMTATEIAAAVDRLKESMRDKGYAKADANLTVSGGWTVLIYPSGMMSGVGHVTATKPAREAFDEAFGYVLTLPINDPQARSAEALRAALAAAREAGVDVAEIVGAGE